VVARSYKSVTVADVIALDARRDLLWADLMTLYDDLGLAPDATEAEIKAAHRAHARKHHPDNGGSTENFARGQRAYEVLIDPRRRQHYDQTGGESPRDPEAIERAEVLETIGQAVMQFIAGDTDVERTDVAALAMQALRQAIAEAVANKAKLETGLERIDKAAKRFQLSAEDAADLVGQVLEGRRRQVALQIDQCEHTIRIRSRALEALEGYTYRIEEPPPVGGLDYNELVNMLHRRSKSDRGPDAAPA
jgi:curved DNA-binding protein CbpA